jgi:hypothetical protein
MTIFVIILDAREGIPTINLHIQANVMALAAVSIANLKHADWLLVGLKVIVKIIILGLIY